MKVDFSGGAYLARSLSASAEQQINLYAEPDPPDGPHKVTLYPRPGLELAIDFTAIPGAGGRVRGVYAASNGALYVVVGYGVYYVSYSGGFSPALLGSLGAPDTGFPVSMSDNGSYLFIVDGSTRGWTVNLATNAFAQISDPNFYGSSRVDFIDTFFIFNRPNSQQWYISNPNDITFNSLYFVNKEGYNDYVISIAALHDVIWIFGAVTTETWFNSGAADFPFQRMPQGILQQGCIAPYSIVVADNAVYWLSKDRLGRNILLRGEGYAARRVSNFAVENEWSQYQVASDAIGMAYQIGGHMVINLLFPTANKSWCYDTSTGMWFQAVYNVSSAWLPACTAFWNPQFNVSAVVAGDHFAPLLYVIYAGVYTDNGVPIIRTRSWPHVLNDQKRLAHNQFVAAMPGGAHLTPDSMSLSWSDDGGQTFGTPVAQTTNGASNGQYSWRRLGMARDRVYQLTWTATGETALNGAWLEATPADT